MAEKLLYVLAGYDDDTEEKLSGMQDKLYELGFTGVQTKDIPMHFTLGSFDVSREHVLFVKPEENREMLALREHFRDNVDVFPWAAHTTLLIDKPDVIQVAQTHVMEEFRPFSGKVTTLYLYEFFPARHILSVRLSAAGPERL